MIQNKTPVIIGSDHAAYPLKEEIKKFLIENGIHVEDAGVYHEGSADYPDFAVKVAGMVSKGVFKHGILLCGTGLGMSMAANRFKNIRAALCTDIFSAIMSRRHNDANILILGGRTTGPGLAVEIVKAWLDTDFEGGRHQKRIDKFNSLGES